jgi:hypothetical protein
MRLWPDTFVEEANWSRSPNFEKRWEHRRPAAYRTICWAIACGSNRVLRDGVRPARGGIPPRAPMVALVLASGRWWALAWRKPASPQDSRNLVLTQLTSTPIDLSRRPMESSGLRPIAVVGP